MAKHKSATLVDGWFSAVPEIEPHEVDAVRRMVGRRGQGDADDLLRMLGVAS